MKQEQLFTTSMLSSVITVLTIGLLCLHSAQARDSFDPTGTYEGIQQCNETFGDESEVFLIGPGNIIEIVQTDTSLMLTNLEEQYSGVCTTSSSGFDGISCNFVALGCAQIIEGFCEVLSVRVGIFSSEPTEVDGAEMQNALLATSTFSTGPNANGEGDPGVSNFGNCTWDYRRVEAASVTAEPIVRGKRFRRSR